MKTVPDLVQRQFKVDRNTHEFSAEESSHTVSLGEQKRGGGYRSGSSGAGTSDHEASPRPADHGHPGGQHGR